MLKQRIITALVLLPIALGGFFLLDGGAFALFIGAVVTLGAWEWARLAGFEAQPLRVAYAAAVAVLLGLLYMVPVVATLQELDEDALIQILIEPKNALIKQYQKFLAMDNVELEFRDEALQAIAQEALKRNTGARGLRSIIERIMRNVMYDVPSRDDVSRCVVTEEVVRSQEEPMLICDRKKKKKDVSA